MASSSKAPTGRKKPVILPLIFKGAAKTKEREKDTSERRGGKIQGRWTMSASQGPVMVGNKRKTDLENRSCPNEANSKGIVAAASNPETGLAAKKQKTETEEHNAEASSPPNLQASNPSAALRHSSTPTAPSQAIQNFTTLLTHVLQHNAHVLPTSPFTAPLASPHIDAIAHIVWQVAFTRGDLLQRAYLSIIKLA